MKEKITIKTISIKDLWNVLRGCYLFMIIAAVAVTAGMYAYAKSNYAPMYSSKATLYLLGTGGDGENISQWTADYTLAKVVIDDSTYLLTSRTVLNKVGDELGIANGYGAFKSGISIVNPEGTRVLEITATASSPELAKQIVDGVCTVGPQSIDDVLKYNQMQVFEAGTYNPYPINSISFTSYLKFGIIAAALVYVVFIALFLFDTYIHTDDDIEHYLGLTIIGDIPDANAGKKKGKYAYGKTPYANNPKGGKK